MRQIIVKWVTPDSADVIFRVAVPDSLQPQYAGDAIASADPDAPVDETTALRDGRFVEQIDRVQFLPLTRIDEGGKTVTKRFDVFEKVRVLQPQKYPDNHPQAGKDMPGTQIDVATDEDSDRLADKGVLSTEQERLESLVSRLRQQEAELQDRAEMLSDLPANLTFADGVWK